MRTPLTGPPAEALTTLKATVPLADFFGTSNAGTGSVSASSTVEAETPMPRLANADQIRSVYFAL
ncbi:unannotated protein [freshwater metagenome]|uniref:Unannotated protein n=1 Tax=freshwater metagenome TaxID=449393 RepID=A0A6J6QLF5_9ZZZZ